MKERIEIEITEKGVNAIIHEAIKEKFGKKPNAGKPDDTKSKKP